MADIEIKVDARGAQRMLGAIRAAKADNLVAESFNRIARSVRAGLVKKVRSRFPGIPKKQLDQRITIDIPKRRFRIYGAGKRGGAFIRPRWLNLSVGKHWPQWRGLRSHRFPRTWAVTPLKGSKASKKQRKAGNADGKQGRNFAIAGSKKFKIANAVVFQRKDRHHRSAIRPIQGPDTMGAIVASITTHEAVRMELTNRLAKEVERRLKVEMKRRK